MNFKQAVAKVASRSLGHAVLAVCIGTCLVESAYAQSASDQVTYQIQAGSLSSALDQFSKQTGIQILYQPEIASGKRSASVSGRDTPEAVLKQILRGTGLEYSRVNANTFVVRPRPKPTRATVKSEPQASVSDEKKSVQDLEEIVVVGSRLGESDALPIIVIRREDIERSGASSISQVLSERPEVSLNNNGDTILGSGGAGGLGGGSNSTTVQLRGLPQGTTLVLVNGRRVGYSAAFADSAQFDLSTVPLSMVERIEILPAGAAAVYGGDGLAGVVNIVLRKNAQGTEITQRFGIASRYIESQSDITWAKNWGRGSVMLTAAFTKNDALMTTDRAITASDDLTSYGGRDYRRTAGNPGNVYSLAGCPAPPRGCSVALANRGNLPGLSSSFAGVPFGQDGIGLQPSDFISTQGVLNRTTAVRSIYLPSEKYSVGANASFDLTDKIELFSEANYFKNRVVTSGEEVSLSSGQRGTTRMSASNPYNPFGVAVGVDYNYQGDDRQYAQEYSRFLLGARGEIGSWSWDAAAWISKDESSLDGAFLTVQDFLDAQAALTAALASSDPATAFNPLRGDGEFGGSDALRALLFPTRRVTYSSELRGFSANAKGTLFTLPTGKVTALVGGEYTKDKLNYATGYSPVDGSDETKAIFGELRVPVIGKGSSGKERLIVSAAGRIDRSGRFEEDGTSEILGLEYRPSEAWLLRAAYTTSFKPLTIFSASQITGTPFAFDQYDPVLDSVYSYAVFFGGGVPRGLKPEEGETTSVGFAFAPSWSSKLRVNANVWDTKISNRIAEVDTSTIILRFPERVTRDPDTNLITVVDARPVNIFDTRVSGVDLSADWQYKTRFGTVIPSLAATYTYRYDQQYSVDAPVSDYVGKLSFTGWAPKWKSTARVTWDSERGSIVSLTGRYISKYVDFEPYATGPNAGEYPVLGDFWVLDASAQFEIGKWIAPTSNILGGTKLSLGIVNLLNERPQFCSGCGSTGYDATQADIRGRYAYVQIRVAL